jgi:hypothetical protein
MEMSSVARFCLSLSGVNTRENVQLFDTHPNDNSEVEKITHEYM